MSVSGRARFSRYAQYKPAGPPPMIAIFNPSEILREDGLTCAQASQHAFSLSSQRALLPPNNPVHRSGATEVRRHADGRAGATRADASRPLLGSFLALGSERS